jgi:hypothetical protein
MSNASIKRTRKLRLRKLAKKFEQRRVSRAHKKIERIVRDACGDFQENWSDDHEVSRINNRPPETHGHMQWFHVAKSDEFLRLRAKQNPLLNRISTFTNKKIAEQVVAAAIQNNLPLLDRWLKSTRTTLELHFLGNETVGRVLQFCTSKIVDSRAATVILKRSPSGRRPFFLLVAYPTI